MSRLIPQQQALLVRAAEFRAAGTPWTAIATELQVADDDLRDLRDANTRLFRQLVRRANHEFEDETLRSTLARLRELMKSANEGVALAAAGIVIRCEMLRMRRDER